jgi:tRNA A-37 threonylcarbamoyl transferase component Bud32
MEKISNLEVISRIEKYVSVLSKLSQSLSENTKNLSESEKVQYIKSALDSNESFSMLRNEKSFIRNRTNVVFEELEKLETIYEMKEVPSNSDLKEAQGNIENTQVVDLDNTDSKKKKEPSVSSNSINAGINHINLNDPSSNKLNTIGSKEAPSIDWSKDPTAQVIANNSEYSPIKYISRGQFGKVYKVVSKKDNKEYAMKTIPTDGNLPSKYLYVEQKAHLTLNNTKEHIIYCYDQIQVDTNIRALILELADDSLDNFIKTNYPTGIPEHIAFFFIEQIYKGIKFMHSKNLIHRDIKPANVLIKDFKAKICDFNVCRFFDDPEPKFTTVATPGYAAPEVIRPNTNFQKEDWHKVDVYSMGVLLYFMLYGKLPYEFNRNLTVGNNWEKAVREINYSHTDHKISDEAVEFIKTCLSVKLEDRPTLENLKSSRWFKKVGTEFNAVVKSNKILNHKHLYELIKKTINK